MYARGLTINKYIFFFECSESFISQVSLQYESIKDPNYIYFMLPYH